MTRQMIDCTNTNVPAVNKQFPNIPMVGTYVTGTPDIAWGVASQAMWPNAVHVTIDQYGPHSPVFSAMVRDVEQYAWPVSKAIDTRGWNTPRPTIYCSRSTLMDVMREGWGGDVWLAYPGYTKNIPPAIPGVRIVAVQHTYSGDYDISTVFDDAWPYAVSKEAEMLHITVPPLGARYIPFPEGSFKEVMVYRDFLSAIHTATVRVAAHSHSVGYTVHEVLLNSNSPATVTFPHPDTDAVSVENSSNEYDVGITLA